MAQGRFGGRFHSEATDSPEPGHPTQPVKADPNNSSEPPRLAARRSWPTPLVLGLIALVAAGAAVLFWFDPARHAFYPVCLFKKLTGYDCPGCGGLRAVHELLRGDVWHAFQLNAMAVVTLPLLLTWAIFVWMKSSRGGRPGRIPTVWWACGTRPLGLAGTGT